MLLKIRTQDDQEIEVKSEDLGISNLIHMLTDSIEDENEMFEEIPLFNVPHRVFLKVLAFTRHYHTMASGHDVDALLAAGVKLGAVRALFEMFNLALRICSLALIAAAPVRLLQYSAPADGGSSSTGLMLVTKGGEVECPCGRIYEGWEANGGQIAHGGLIGT